MAQNENTTQNTAQEIHDEDTKLRELAEKSKIANMMGKTKVVYIDEGKPTMYGLKLQFPGVSRATRILNMAGSDPIEVLSEAIKDVVVVPKISSVDGFWNEHTGIAEALEDIMTFLDITATRPSDEGATNSES